MTKRLDAETKRLHALSRAALADEIGDHQTAIEALKAEAIRRGYLRVEGIAYRVGALGLRENIEVPRASRRRPLGA
jgi:hypothetical protein